jgi:prolyl-tRNA editing enzyme YbaK/EbsC (Cys-tRNA(Pro) deacylase)
LAHTGFLAGSVPPFGHLQPIQTVVETAVTQLDYNFIYGGGGDVNVNETDGSRVVIGNW